MAICSLVLQVASLCPNRCSRLQGHSQESIGADMIRIGIDARCLNCDHLRGIGRYVLELLSQMTPKTDLQYRLYADRPDLPFHLPTSIDRASADEFEMW